MRGAVFTIVRNERHFLPVWLRYYGEFFAPEDIYVVDNGSTDLSTAWLEAEGRCVVCRQESDYADDVQWLVECAMRTQRELLSRYDWVIFTDTDEIVVPKTPGDFERHLQGRNTVRCTGWEVCHVRLAEPDLDWKVPLLRQRSRWLRMNDYDKPVLSRVPSTWEHGYHTCVEPAEIDPDLLLIHLRRIDFKTFREHLELRRNWARPPHQDKDKGWQWLLRPEDAFSWFDQPLVRSIQIPEEYRDAC